MFNHSDRRYTMAFQSMASEALAHIYAKNDLNALVPLQAVQEVSEVYQASLESGGDAKKGYTEGLKVLKDISKMALR